MSTVHTLQPPPRVVKPILVDSAVSLGLEPTIMDPVIGHFEFRTAARGSGKSTRIAIALTDNGYGQTSVHVTVDPAGSWAGRRAAKRLIRMTSRDSGRPE